MPDKTVKLIQELKESKLFAECPCGGEFKLSSALLFDGTKPFPPEALKKQQELKEELKERKIDLGKQKTLATGRAQNTTKATNIGKVLEKIFPSMDGFQWPLADSRFLGEPIDFIVFNGLTNGKVKSIDFVEVKTGGAKLSPPQKTIKTAIEDGDVYFEVFK
jgi:predicted Holliday junction resolvase-like endonuclease